MRKILFVVNPVAGNGDGKKLIPILKDEFRYCDNEIIVSMKNGIITQIVKEKLSEDKYTDIIAVGGDGTLTEVLNGIIDLDINIGIIPIGSGNDFSKTIKINKNIESCIDIIKRNHVRKIYTGNINGINFINVIGIGIDAAILNYKDNSKFLKGKLNYLVSTIKGIFNYSPDEKKIYIDGKLIKAMSIFIAVGNGMYIGNGMKITPNSNVENEKFGICIISDLSKYTLLKSITKLYKGIHSEVDGVEMYEGKEIIIDFEKETAVDIDGNLVKCNSVCIKKNKLRVNFLVKG